MKAVSSVGERIKIVLYRWAGERWIFRIRTECPECDLVVGQLRALESEHPDWPLDVEVKPWLTYLWESLRRGGWHAPVLVVDGRVVSQGRVPTRGELETKVQLALARCDYAAMGQQQPKNRETPIPAR